MRFVIKGNLCICVEEIDRTALYMRCLTLLASMRLLRSVLSLHPNRCHSCTVGPYSNTLYGILHSSRIISISHIEAAYEANYSITGAKTV